jgi:hypothetical protein
MAPCEYFLSKYGDFCKFFQEKPLQYYKSHLLVFFCGHSAKIRDQSVVGTTAISTTAPSDVVAAAACEKKRSRHSS